MALALGLGAGAGLHPFPEGVSVIDLKDLRRIGQVDPAVFGDDIDALSGKTLVLEAKHPVNRLAAAEGFIKAADSVHGRFPKQGAASQRTSVCRAGRRGGHDAGGHQLRRSEIPGQGRYAVGTGLAQLFLQERQGFRLQYIVRVCQWNRCSRR